MNKGKTKGRDVISPGPRLASVLGARTFLALLLSASQEVVREPAYQPNMSRPRRRGRTLPHPGGDTQVSENVSSETV